ncbi:MAG TPA: hypothetical protein VEI07_05560 [Planctomycetaceae bacterium]|nr:hypothetical protein [Planctomycetaceae bacterium]
MSAPALKREIEKLERQLEMAEAWAKLDEAARLIHEVAEKYPNTPAANTANEAVRVIEQRRQMREGFREGFVAPPTN